MRSFAVLALAARCVSTPGLASPAYGGGQLPSPDEVATRDSVTLAAGAAVMPDYEGSNNYRLVPVVALRGHAGGISFITRGAYLYVDLVPKDGGKLDFNAGPLAGVRLTTFRHVHDSVVELLPRRKHAVEAGAFAGVSLHGLTNPYDTLGFRVDVTRDIGGAHKSTIISPNVEFSTPLSRTTFASLSGGMEFVSNRFADYYYTVTPEESVTTGLPDFNASGGMKNWTLNLLINQSLGGNLLHGFSIFGAGQFSHLAGDFKRSPIVSKRGSASQWIGAFGLAYTW